MLSREQISLVNADIDAIEDMLDEKGNLLQRINASVQVRYKALFKAGLFAETTGKATEAIDFYKRIKDEYPKNGHANDVDKYSCTHVRTINLIASDKRDL